MTKSTLKEKMLAFYHSIIFQVIAALLFFALGFGVSALINHPISAKYLESGIIIGVDPSDGEDFKYDISVKREEFSIPIHELIELLGILIDNACEEVKDSSDCMISLKIKDNIDIMLPLIVAIFKGVTENDVIPSTAYTEPFGL